MQNPQRIRTNEPDGSSGKEPACQCGRCETLVQSLGWGDPLEEGMATLSSILAWRIPRAEDLVGYSHLFIQKKTAGVLFSASTLGYPCAFNMFSPNDRDDLFLSPESSSSDF